MRQQVHRADLLRELTGLTCACGNAKGRGKSFCRTCYFKLPKLQRVALYSRFGEGYEEAYATAAGLLQVEREEKSDA